MKEPIPATYNGLPALTAQAMRALDRRASEEFNIPALDLMENAGRAVADETARFIKDTLKRRLEGAVIAVCCGRGANGGDGLAAARHLAGQGAKVFVFLCPPRKEGPAAEGVYPEIVRVNLEKAKAAGVIIERAGPESGLRARLEESVVVLDALLGTGSSGKPAGAVHHMIQEINKSLKPVLAVDIPSGVHPDTGYHSGVFVKAARTLTLGLPKRGLLAPHAKKYVGELLVLDIGYPKELATAPAIVSKRP